MINLKIKLNLFDLFVSFYEKLVNVHVFVKSCEVEF